MSIEKSNGAAEERPAEDDLYGHLTDKEYEALRGKVVALHIETDEILASAESAEELEAIMKDKGVDRSDWAVSGGPFSRELLELPRGQLRALFGC